jgi:hypothetical protein
MEARYDTPQECAGTVTGLKENRAELDRTAETSHCSRRARMAYYGAGMA